jgi:competence protein ComEC
MLAAAAGIAATSLFSALPPQPLVVASLPLLLPFLFCAPRGLRFCAAVAAGVCWGVLCGHRMLASALPAEREGSEAELRLCIEDLPVRGREHGLTVWRLRGRILAPPAFTGLPSWRGRAVEFSWYGEGDFHPGELWRMRLRLRAPRGFLNPGSPDRQAWLHADGVDATGYASAIHAARREGRCNAGADPWRERLRGRLLAVAGEGTAAAGLLALTIGDASLFRPADWELFARTGTTHLVVISGMHISLVAGLAFAFGLRLARRFPGLAGRLPARAWGAVFALPAVFVYAALAGWSLSVQRAVLMALVLVLAVLLERHRPVVSSLALAALMVLVWQPLAALQPGFWLSFLSVAALMLGLGGRLASPGWCEALWRPQCVVAIALAAPLLAMGLPQAPLGPLVNLFAIPLVDLIAVPSALIGCLLSGVSDVLARPFLELALFALELLGRFLRFSAGLSPDLVQATGSPPPWTIVLAVAGSLWMLAPPGFPARALGALLFLPALFPLLPPAPAPALRLLMLDVGQGSAAVLLTARHSVVFDAGPRYSERFDAGRALLVPALRALGVDAVDLLVLSHADNDHTGGAQGLRDAMPVHSELAGEPLPDTGTRRCAAGMHWRQDGVDFRLLHPQDGDRREGNTASCVLRVEAAGRVILLTGDIDADAERALLATDAASLRADVVLVPHHGSRSSSSPRFVQAVLPRYALVSAGFRNRFGHPHPDVAARWRAAGASVIDTAGSGAVLLRVEQDGKIASPVLWREQERRFWHRARED